MENPDVISEVALRKRDDQIIVGFAAETHDVRGYAAAKLAAKGVDLMVANDVSRSAIGFESEDNEVVLLDRWGGIVELPRASKLAIADALLDRVLALRAASGVAAPAPGGR